MNLDKDRALADAFLAEVPAEFALRFDPAGALAKEFGVQAMPSSLPHRRRRQRARDATSGFKTAETADYERAIRKPRSNDHDRKR